MSKQTPIGDPLDAYERARNGQLGGKRRSGTEDASDVPLIEREAKPVRIARTYYLPPLLAKWVKTYAAEHEVQTSELVTLALEEYKRRHAEE